MDLHHTLTIYFVILLLLTFLLVRYRIRLRSAIVFGVIICQIVLNCICPPTDVDLFGGGSGSAAAVYFGVQFIGPVIMVVYALCFCWHDRRES